jgi:hypothetical protein
MKLCPSQTEEMIQIGAISYSNIIIYQEDLKQAIPAHPLWTPIDPNNPPIFNLYLSDFIASGKKTKMIFVSAEQSRFQEVSDIFKNIYDGTPKAYPNGCMMVFVPFANGNQESIALCQKILFSHINTMAMRRPLASAVLKT